MEELNERPPKKSLKGMTKSERREYQESQRRAKTGETLSDSNNLKKNVTIATTFNNINTPVINSNFVSHNKTPTRAASSLFAHLPRPLERPVSSAAREQPLHPAVVQLALQFADFTISGANARTRSMLHAFRVLIKDYATPGNGELSRELMPCLSRHIAFLTSVRPLAAPMGNAIRQLKKEISAVAVGTSELEAKKILQEKIDEYIAQRITLATRVLADHGITKIRDGDVVLTYGYSSTVKHIFTTAAKLGRKFRVVVVTSRPKLEGTRMAAALLKHQICCTLVHMTALAHVMPCATTTVLLGAQSLLSNGALVSRVGSCQVAMMAHYCNVPVIVACESHKFSVSVHLDSIVCNELGRRDEFAIPQNLLRNSDVSNIPSVPQTSSISSNIESPSVKMLNVLFDVTPPEFITAVITELGIVPCTSIRVIIREYMPLIESTS